MKRLILLLLLQASFFALHVAIAQEQYYRKAEGLRGLQLKAALHDIIQPNKVLGYGGGYGKTYLPSDLNVWQTFDETVEVPPTAHYFVFGVNSYFGTTIYVDDCWVMDVIETTVKGDVNGDGVVDVADIESVLSVMFGSGIDGETSADVNSDGNVDISDVVSIISEITNL